MKRFRNAGIPADCVLSPAEAMAILAGHGPFYDLAENTDEDDS